MSLVIATGSNLDDPIQQLSMAKIKLSKHWPLLAESRIYQSSAVDYFDQPDFFNQVLEFSLPTKMNPDEVMKVLLEVENEMGRVRLVDKGPRVIDIDLLFWDLTSYKSNTVEVPHPRLWTRSFVIKPLSELPVFARLKTQFAFTENFSVDATPLN